MSAKKKAAKVVKSKKHSPKPTKKETAAAEELLTVPSLIAAMITALEQQSLQLKVIQATLSSLQERTGSGTQTPPSPAAETHPPAPTAPQGPAT